MSRAAAALRREAELGSLAVGRVADISLIRITEGEFPLTDSEGAVEMARYNLELAGTIRAGQVGAGTAAAAEADAEAGVFLVHDIAHLHVRGHAGNHEQHGALALLHDALAHLGQVMAGEG